MWHLALYAAILVVVGIASFEGLRHVRAQRAKAAAEKAAEEAGPTVEARERMVNELLFAPTFEEITAHALGAARNQAKQQPNKDDIRAPEGFFIGVWSDRLHILYTEAIVADRGIHEFPAFYDAGMNTFAKRREAIEKLVQKYRGVRSPSEFNRNFRLAQEYLEPILIQMCARPSSERGALKAPELEAFADALRLAYTLCPGSWRGLAEIIKFLAQDVTTEDLAALSQTGKRAMKVIALRPVTDKDHKTGVLMNVLAKTVVARISRKCSFEDASARPCVAKSEWDSLWRQAFKPAPAGQPADQNATSIGDIQISVDQRRLCSYIECFEVEGRPEGEDGKPKPKQFMRCSKCKHVAYCCVECQTKHWKAGHKNQCAELAKKNPPVTQKAAAAVKKAAQPSQAQVLEESEDAPISDGGLKERKKAAK